MKKMFATAAAVCLLFVFGSTIVWPRLNKWQKIAVMSVPAISLAVLAKPNQPLVPRVEFYGNPVLFSMWDLRFRSEIREDSDGKLKLFVRNVPVGQVTMFDPNVVVLDAPKGKMTSPGNLK